MPNREEVVELFLSLLKEIGKASRNIGDDFSGLGLVLYDSKLITEIHHTDLRPAVKCPDDISLKCKISIDILLRISDKSNTCHDGFHFFNEIGQLTHISQYLGSPIIPGVKPCELYGARHLSAQYAAHMEGVIAVGIVTTDGEVFYFTKGGYHKEAEK